MVFSALKALIVAVAAAAACHSAALASSESKSKHKKSRHLFVEVLDAKGITDKDWFNEPDPYARVQVLDRKDKSPSTCREGKYEIRPETRNPGWFRTKMICREYPEDTSDLRLRVTLRDDDPIGYDDLGHADVPLSNVTMGEVMTLKVRKDTQTIRIRVREHFPKDLKKRIYLVRDASKKYLTPTERGAAARAYTKDVAEAKATGRYYSHHYGHYYNHHYYHYGHGYHYYWWSDNEPEDPVKDYYHEDYPLNVNGRKQALALAGYIDAVKNNGSIGTRDEKAFVASRKAMSSPLSSAVMTAVIALDPLLAPNGTLKGTAPLYLKQDARDRRKGDATKGKRSGGDLANRLMRYMDQYLFNPLPPTMKATVKQLDLSEVWGTWWLNENESDKALRSRLFHFFVEQMLWEDDDDIILVGHAKFFREFLQAQMQSELKDNIAACNEDHRHLPYCEKYGPYSLAQFWKYDMDHCAVLAVDLDYSSVVQRMEDPEGGSDDVKIVRDIGFLFGSGLWGVIPRIN